MERKLIIHFIDNVNETHILTLETSNNIRPYFSFDGEGTILYQNKIYNSFISIGFIGEISLEEKEKIYDFYQNVLCKILLTKKITNIIIYQQFEGESIPKEMINTYAQKDIIVDNVSFMELYNPSYFLGFRLYTNPVIKEELNYIDQEWIL